eukprot:241682_1
MVNWSKIAVGGTMAFGAILLVSKHVGKGLRVVWDLDDTLIKSEHLETYTDESKKCSIVKMNRYVLEHIDDDIMHFRTYIRPWTRFVLSVLKWIGVEQYVFTSATVGYMNNVCIFLDPHHHIFEAKRLSTSDFEKGFLRKNGKNIKLLFKDNDQDISRSMLIDDKIRYHQPQTEYGLLCNVFTAREEKELTRMNIWNDMELLRILYIVLRCCFVSDISSILIKYQTDDYKLKNKVNFLLSERTS